MKLFIAAMYGNEETYNQVKNILIKDYSSLLFESQPYSFDRFTSYYQKEMGRDLLKRFLIFCLAIEKKDLIKIKQETRDIEQRFAVDSKRTINLDPGYISTSELVLASFKRGTNYKELIGEGVYAHKVLGFEGDRCAVFWHTFPDYREHQPFFAFLKKSVSKERPL